MQQTLSKKLLFLVLFFGLSAANVIKAVCPVCVVAIGGGVGFCRWLGFDDIISGTWVGAMILAIIIWTLDWMNKRNIRFNFRNPIVFLVFYIAVIWPLYLSGIMGHPANTVWGVDKILVGIILGTFLLTLTILFEHWLRKKNNGKVYFYYQKVVIPVVILIIASAILHFIIGCQIKILFLK